MFDIKELVMETMRRITRSYLPIWSQKEINNRITILTEKKQDHMQVLDFLEMFDIKRLIEEEKIVVDNSDEVLVKLNQFLKFEFYRRVKTLNDVLKYFTIAYDKENRRTELFSFRETVLDIFKMYDFSKIVSDDDLKKIIKAYDIQLFTILKSDYWKKKYPNLLKEIFLSKTKHFELFLEQYTDNGIKYFIPENITKDDYYSLALRYIQDEPSSEDISFESNLNYLQLLTHNLDGISKFLEIDSEMKLMISEQIVKRKEQLFKKSEANEYKVTVYLDSNAQPDNKNAMYSVLDKDYFIKYGDTASVMSYIKYLEGLFTTNGILYLCSFKNIETNAFSQITRGVKPKKNYDTGIVFDTKNQLVLLEISAIDKLLQNYHHKSFESIFKDFFSDYSNTILHLKWIKIPFADNQSLSVRIKILLTSEENLRKQWNLYTRKKAINPKLFSFERTPDFKHLPSILPKKYIYSASKTTDRIIRLLYSNKTMLGHINSAVNEKNIVSLLTKHDIKYTDFSENQLIDLNFLLQENVVSRNENDLLFFSKYQNMMLRLYYNIWSYEVINYYNFPSVFNTYVGNSYQKLIDDSIEKGIFCTESTLFAKPEIDFMNYLLNDSFNNSKGIRNKHEHGDSLDDDNSYYEDYLYSVIVFLVYIVKINEELHFQNLLQGDEGYWLEPEP